MVQSRGGTIGGNRRRVAAGSASLLGSGGGIVSPPRGSDAEPREPSTFPTKNSSNERRKRVERRTIADPFTLYRQKSRGGAFSMLSTALKMGGGCPSPPPKKKKAI